MSQYNRPTSSMSASAGGAVTGTGSGGPGREKTYFEQQREALIGEIAMDFEHVLANINKLNRSLEAVIAVGNEFSSVEALWSQFENVMAKEPEQQQQQQQQAGEDEEAEEADHDGHGHEQDDDDAAAHEEQDTRGRR